MKLRKQRNGYECGPIAVYNAEVLLGLKPTPLTELHYELNTDKDGTYADDMRGYLIENLNAICLNKPRNNLEKDRTRVTLAAGLNTNVIVVLGYYVNDYGHYTTLFYAPSRGSWFATNTQSDKSLSKLSYKKNNILRKVSDKWIFDKIIDSRSDVYIIRR